MKPVRLIIMAKAPTPGFAKTRLIPALGKAGAAALAHTMLQRTLAAALAAEVGPVELCATPAFSHPDWHDVALPPRVEVSEQGPGDIGARMASALSAHARAGTWTILLGTDCAEMDAALLREAAGALQHADAVLYPTADGGYAVLGLRHFHPEIFRDIAWSSDCVTETTLLRLQALGQRTHIGCTLHDIDEPEDLAHWPTALP